MKWQDIEKANEEIIPLVLTKSYKDEQGNWQKKDIEYCEVKERVKAFRKICPSGNIDTDYTFTDNYVYFTAIVTDENGKQIAKGHARKLLKESKYAYELAETSAVGRALANCGIGIQNSIASADDIEDMEDKIFDEPIISRKDLVNEFTKVFTNEEQANVLNFYHVTSINKLSDQQIKGCLDGKKHNSR